MTTKAKDLTERLRELREQDESLWDLAVDTADVDSEEREEAAREARDDAAGVWDDVEDALEEGRLADARAKLEELQPRAAEWGDDTPVREAIEAVQAAMAVLDLATWHQRPRDAGQAVDVRWCAVEGGVIRRTIDRSTGVTSYSLHEWLDDEEDVRHEPWNGHLGCELEGDEITASEAARLIGEGAR